MKLLNIKTFAVEIDRNNIMVFDQVHQMYADGMVDGKPTEQDISDIMLEDDWVAHNIEIWHDDTQQVWRFYCDIIHILNK